MSYGVAAADAAYIEKYHFWFTSSQAFFSLSFSSGWWIDYVIWIFKFDKAFLPFALYHSILGSRDDGRHHCRQWWHSFGIDFFFSFFILFFSGWCVQNGCDGNEILFVQFSSVQLSEPQFWVPSYLCRFSAHTHTFDAHSTRTYTIRCECDADSLGKEKARTSSSFYLWISFALASIYT